MPNRTEELIVSIILLTVGIGGLVALVLSW